MPYSTINRKERDEAAAAAAAMAEEDQDMDLLWQDERLPNFVPVIPIGEEGPHDDEEPEEPEPEERLDDEEDDPQRLNRGTGPKRKRVTQCEFYSSVMSIRGYFNNALAGGPLTQQWVVYSYVKIEANRVKYIREHQTDLHVAQYSGLLDYINNRAERENLTVGQVIVLP
jgi:hypothetical protein